MIINFNYTIFILQFINIFYIKKKKILILINIYSNIFEILMRRLFFFIFFLNSLFFNIISIFNSHHLIKIRVN